ncbi:hypothetical protein [Roseisolibacter sp. H3M3-2]|uniref:hypothetical protein n=1 Tax=Roseisolibacter sp. H3M3-2 TaxID=3031323 RepID=UPI0023DCA598|nr:hypothetical protein [Roseisolibacter sp. H3M3-2]MDF1502276.1 hypothetical protein [Roseisolibacter sp. H3M3-2]
MERREFVQTTVLGAAALASSRLARALDVGVRLPAPGTTVHVSPVTGNDANAGGKSAPLRTLPEAARRVSRGAGSGPLTVVLSEGIHAVGETALFNPPRGRFTRTDRLTIRAEVLPDDPGWHHGRMPTLIHTLPVKDTWNGRPDPLGGAADGMLIETSHVSIRGLRVLGMPVVETPREGMIRRLYAVSRLREDLDDLEVAQCVFAGDEVIAPNHVGIIARGNGLVVDHCVFRGLKISAVYWSGGSTGHAMRHCVNDGLYGSAVWTAGIADDFDYRNNVVANCNYAWTHQDASSARADAGGQRGAAGVAAGAPAQPRARSRYRVLDSHFANNRRLAGSGTGARLEYQDIDPSFLELVGTKVTEQRAAFEHEQAKPSYLHPVAGSEAAATGAGLFMTRRA